jgi:hypothetical protein
MKAGSVDAAKAQAEFRRELEKLEKERKHLENVRRALPAKGDVAGAEKLQSELDEVVSGIEGVHQREANIRAGYVCVISNLGAFGSKMVKIGMTRRLQTKLHQALSDRGVNRVNLRREFFHATPEDVRELLKKHSGQMLEHVLEPEAAEYRQSMAS